MPRTAQRGQDFEGQDQESANNVLQAKSPNPAMGLFLEVKFYWNADTPAHLHIVYGCWGRVRL